jgi:DNA mismatch endonuclease (patch repair protein)
MADVHTPEIRSRNMAAIRSRDTKPEIAVRRIVHRLGYRFRLTSRLPGRPDLVLPRHRKVIFVHGCFWHMHDCRFGRVVPRTRSEFWTAKRLSNVERDRRALRELEEHGWEVLIIWECSLKNPIAVTSQLIRFLTAD